MKCKSLWSPKYDPASISNWSYQFLSEFRSLAVIVSSPMLKYRHRCGQLRWTLLNTLQLFRTLGNSRVNSSKHSLHFLPVLTRSPAPLYSFICPLSAFLYPFTCSFAFSLFVSASSLQFHKVEPFSKHFLNNFCKRIEFAISISAIWV